MELAFLRQALCHLTICLIYKQKNFAAQTDCSFLYKNCPVTVSRQK